MAMLALSTSIASILEALALFIILYRRIGGFNLSALADFLVRTLVATIVMALVVFSIREGLDNLFSTTSAPTLATGGVLLAFIKLFIEIAIGAFVYLFVARRLDIEEINSGPVRRLLNRFHITWL